jgi:hypothetical protein
MSRASWYRHGKPQEKPRRASSYGEVAHDLWSARSGAGVKKPSRTLADGCRVEKMTPSGRKKRMPSLIRHMRQYSTEFNGERLNLGVIIIIIIITNPRSITYATTTAKCSPVLSKLKKRPVPG